MVKIRLRRQGKKRQPVYRIVVAESRAPRDGAFIETLGYYNPLTQPETIELNEERLRHWMSNGAQPSDALEDLLRRKGLISHETRVQRSAVARRDAQARAKVAAEKAEKAAAAKAAKEEAAKAAEAKASADAAAATEAADTAKAEAAEADAPGDDAASEEESSS